MRTHKLEDQAVELLATSMVSDTEVTFNSTAMNLTGADMARRASAEVYSKTGVSPT